jgi:hypothetical protein
VSGEDGDGELVNDGKGEELDGSPKSKRLSHEADHGPFSIWLGAAKSESSHETGCSGISGRVSANESEISEIFTKLLSQGDAP